MPAQTEAVPPLSRLQIAVMAIRPKTLTAAVGPVAIGAAFAYSDRAFHLPAVLIALLGALLIQIGTNLANDYFDFVKGADTEERKGPVRVTQAGLVSPHTIRNAFVLVFALAFCTGIYLVWRGGWPLVWIGLLSIASGILYTGGPYPLGYNGLGDIFVLIFFGPVAVGGTYYVQALTVTPQVLCAGLAPGLIATALLAINNLRDVESDSQVGKRTLAVRFGVPFVRFEYFFSVLGAGLVPIALQAWTGTRPWAWISIAALLLAVPTARTVFSTQDGPSLNKALGDTGKLLLIHSVLFAIGWVI